MNPFPWGRAGCLHVRIRAARPTDLAGLAAFRDSQSAQSRGFLNVPRLDDLLATRRETIVAVERRSRQVVGVAYWTRLVDEPSRAEFAIAVAVRVQRAGLGWRLGCELERRARLAQITQLYAVVDSSNRPARAALARAGARPLAQCPGELAEAGDVYGFDLVGPADGSGAFDLPTL